LSGIMETALGQVVSVLLSRPGFSELEVLIKGRIEKAVNYHLITGEVKTGDRVVINTSAVSLGLGTGGYHFVITNLSQPVVSMRGTGHIMKLRYTPQQITVQAIEEEVSGCREVFNNFSSLNGLPVIIIPLHSVLAPVVLSIKNLCPQTKVVYLMTEGGALPLYFSRTVYSLQETGFLDQVITSGHSFGGDIEAVNIFSGLIAAKEVLKADIVIVGMGPGHVGTGTKWGFSGIELGEAVNAVGILGGRSLFCPRISFRDQRIRHRGISHHSLTVLERVALMPTTVVLPYLSKEKEELLKKQIDETNLTKKHAIVWESGESQLKFLEDSRLPINTMGRSLSEEKDFFLAACAAGVWGAKTLI